MQVKNNQPSAPKCHFQSKCGLWPSKQALLACFKLFWRPQMWYEGQIWWQKEPPSNVSPSHWSWVALGKCHSPSWCVGDYKRSWCRVWESALTRRGSDKMALEGKSVLSFPSCALGTLWAIFTCSSSNQHLRSRDSE